MTAPPKRYADLLLRYLGPRWPVLLLLFVALTGSIGVQLGMPRMLALFIDRALAGAGVGALITLALWYLALAGANQVLALATNYIGQDLAWKATNAMRVDLFDHCLRLPLPFHTRRTPGELIQRIDGDVGALSGFLSQFSVQILGNLLLLVGVLALLIREDWRIGLAMLLFALLTLLLFRATRQMAVPANKESQEAVAQLMGYIEERLGGLADIRPNGAASWVMRGLYLLGRRRLVTTQRSWVMSASRWAITMSVFLAGNVLALGIGTYLLLTGKMSIGTVYLIYTYTGLLMRPLEQISAQLQEFQKAGAGAARVLELLSAETEPEIPGAPPLPGGALPLACRDLTFRYEEGAPALDRVSFRLEPGRMLGVIGRTGSGKSTLARLLLRFYAPSEGELLLGGREIRTVGLGDLRTRVALVTQEVQLFQATVRDNVALFDPRVPDERIRQALEEVGLGDWLRGQPGGLDTRLGAGGGGLSAGQSQLLAFARALLQDPGLVILDEASSRLDPATERLLEGAMTRLMAGRTAIVIAHRLSTLSRSDEILVLESGRVVEHGERESLATDPNSRFARLLRHSDEADLEVLV